MSSNIKVVGQAAKPLGQPPKPAPMPAMEINEDPVIVAEEVAENVPAKAEPPKVPSKDLRILMDKMSTAAAIAKEKERDMGKEQDMVVVGKVKDKDFEVNKIFRLTLELDASDLHLKVGQPPMMRIRGDIVRLEMRPLSQEDMERLLGPLLAVTARRRQIFEDEGGVDFSHVVGNDEIRFRVSLFHQRSRWSLVSRRVNSTIPNFAQLGLPPIIENLCKYSEGLVILAGVTGSGKSTTIASMLDYVNAREPLHILTIEDPIEFVFTDKMAYINQREIGLDSRDWHKALKDAVQQDPDVILVGELRDVETFEAAVHAAETGHLVFGTIHASSAGTTINRILDLFPPEKHGG